MAVLAVLTFFTSLLIETAQFNMATGRLELAIFPPSSNMTLNNDIKMAKTANMPNMPNTANMANFRI